MTSGPNTSLQIDGETVTDFIFLGSKITADGDCNHEIKRHLLLGRKAISNPDSILISRDVTLLTKVCPIKVMVFPVVRNLMESQPNSSKIIDLFYSISQVYWSIIYTYYKIHPLNYMILWVLTFNCPILALSSLCSLSYYTPLPHPHILKIFEINR